MATAGQIQAFEDLAPEFADADADKIDRMLDRASARTSTSLYPSTAVRDEAVALLAAHNMKDAAGASAGNITSKRVGPLSITYGSTESSGLGTTKYGTQLLELQKSYAFGPMTQVDIITTEEV